METNDLTAKNFETYPDVAADIINVLIYEGLQRTNKDSLLASPTETCLLYTSSIKYTEKK